MSALRDGTAVCRLIARSPFHLDVLRTVRDLDLPDWAIGAGFVRNLVWDHLHEGARPTPLNDIDVVWFDRERAGATDDDAIERQLASIRPDLPWSVKNQARMHERNGDSPYRSVADAMSHWPETATAVAVRLSSADAIELVAPFGLNDLLDLIVRPTPHFRQRRMDEYRRRQAEKDWHALWPRLTFDEEVSI